MKVTKYFGIGSIVFIILFLLDYIIELFQIYETSVKTTLLGLKITTKMTETSLNTNFSLTWRALITYMVFIVLWIIVSCFLHQLRHSK